MIPQGRMQRETGATGRDDRRTTPPNFERTERDGIFEMSLSLRGVAPR